MTIESFDRIGAPLLVLIFIILFFIETRFQLRKRVAKRFKRLVINFIVSIPAFALLRLVFIPVMVWIASENQVIQFGLNYLYELPPLVEAGIAFLLLDYTNYIWHLLNHKIPLLWRFHLVHHTDHDLDITTAFRFHFGELIGSVFFRGAAVFVTGAEPALVLVYELIFEAATEFHHSNWKLPFRLEKILNKIIVTPRMHGIHHSVIKNETDTNYSVIFCFWDRIHRTIKLNIPQNQLVIGVPAYDNHDELTIFYLLKLPFTRIRKWSKEFDSRGSETDKGKLLP